MFASAAARDASGKALARQVPSIGRATGGGGNSGTVSGLLPQEVVASVASSPQPFAPLRQLAAVTIGRLRAAGAGEALPVAAAVAVKRLQNALPQAASRNEVLRLMVVQRRLQAHGGRLDVSVHIDILRAIAHKHSLCGVAGCVAAAELEKAFDFAVEQFRTAPAPLVSSLLVEYMQACLIVNSPACISRVRTYLCQMKYTEDDASEMLRALHTFATQLCTLASCWEKQAVKMFRVPLRVGSKRQRTSVLAVQTSSFHCSVVNKLDMVFAGVESLFLSIMQGQDRLRKRVNDLDDLLSEKGKVVLWQGGEVDERSLRLPEGILGGRRSGNRGCGWKAEDVANKENEDSELSDDRFAENVVFETNIAGAHRTETLWVPSCPADLSLAGFEFDSTAYGSDPLRKLLPFRQPVKRRLSPPPNATAA